eukprot:s118_g9.t1
MQLNGRMQRSGGWQLTPRQLTPRGAAAGGSASDCLPRLRFREEEAGEATSWSWEPIGYPPGHQTWPRKIPNEFPKYINL